MWVLTIENRPLRSLLYGEQGLRCVLLKNKMLLLKAKLWFDERCVWIAVWLKVFCTSTDACVCVWERERMCVMQISPKGVRYVSGAFSTEWDANKQTNNGDSHRISSVRYGRGQLEYNPRTTPLAYLCSVFLNIFLFCKKNQKRFYHWFAYLLVNYDSEHNTMRNAFMLLESDWLTAAKCTTMLLEATNVSDTLRVQHVGVQSEIMKNLSSPTI